MLDATLKAYATRHLGTLALAGTLALCLSAAGRLDARPGAAPAGQITGIATIIDGDTIAIGETRIRLEGIDAPEAAQSCGRRWFGTWACGRASADELAKLTARQTVTCESKGTDKLEELQWEAEGWKIKFGKAHFEALGVDYHFHWDPAVAIDPSPVPSGR